MFLLQTIPLILQVVTFERCKFSVPPHNSKVISYKLKKSAKQNMDFLNVLVVLAVYIVVII